MAVRNEDEQPEVYTIPDNFIKEGYILNGNIRLRNAFEAVIMTGVAALVLWNLPIQDWSIKLTVTVTFSTPMLLIGIIGVNGDPISVFLRNALHWFQSKRILLYNGKIATVRTRPVEDVFNRELPRDRIIYAFDSMKKNHGNDKPGVLVEGRDFVFSDDDEFRRKEAKEKEAAKKAEELARKEAEKAAKKKAREDKKEAKRKAKEAKALARKANKSDAAPVELAPEADTQTDINLHEEDQSIQTQPEYHPDDASNGDQIENQGYNDQDEMNSTYEGQDDAEEAEILEGEVLDEDEEDAYDDDLDDEVLEAEEAHDPERVR